jgi:acetyltransferase-like isoleucine patch superfamily enzyme
MSSNNIPRMKYEEVGGIKGLSKRGLKKNFLDHVVKTTGESSLIKYFWQGTILTLFSNFPTVLGLFLRGYVYKVLLGEVGSNCFIGKNVRFNIPQNISLGDRVFIEESSYFDVQSIEGHIWIKDDVHLSQYCILSAGPGNLCLDEGVFIGPFGYIIGNGGLEIGKNTLIAKNSTIMTESHRYMDPSVPIKFQGHELGKVQIGENVWIGANVVVLTGVTIGDGSVVGAGSVVTTDIPRYGIAAGVPAKVIRKRE